MRFVVALACLAVACASPASGPPAGPQPVSGYDTTVLESVADRYAALAGRVLTPDVVGRTPAAAEQLLRRAGATAVLLAFDPTSRVTRQVPAAGEPLPTAAPVELWLGWPSTPRADRPADDAPTPAGQGPAPAPPPTVADAAPTTAPNAPGAGPQANVPYLLPPHVGPLVVNPSQLPALPPGTALLGLASWYGPGFHGRTTACGQVYDANGATIAARELRCGTVVRVTGPSGRTVEATVTDWGPAEWTGRRFDLSAAVFNGIAGIAVGVVPVRVTVVR